jgi:hypothetical protein
VTDAKGAALVSNARLPNGTSGRVLATIPPNTGTRSIIGTFQLSANQQIIPGDRLKASVGLLAAGATGSAQFAVKVDGQAPTTITVEPGQVTTLDEPLDASQGATTIEIAVTGSAPVVAPGAPAVPGGTSPSATAVNQAIWQNLRIEGTVKNS